MDERLENGHVRGKTNTCFYTLTTGYKSDKVSAFIFAASPKQNKKDILQRLSSKTVTGQEITDREFGTYGITKLDSQWQESYAEIPRMYQSDFDGSIVASVVNGELFPCPGLSSDFLVELEHKHRSAVSYAASAALEKIKEDNKAELLAEKLEYARSSEHLGNILSLCAWDIETRGGDEEITVWGHIRPDGAMVLEIVAHDFHGTNDHETVYFVECPLRKVVK